MFYLKLPVKSEKTQKMPHIVTPLNTNLWLQMLLEANIYITITWAILYPVYMIYVSKRQKRSERELKISSSLSLSHAERLHPTAGSVAGLCRGTAHRVGATVLQLHTQSLLQQAPVNDAALPHLGGMCTAGHGIALSAPRDVLLSGLVILHLEPMV